MAKNDGDQGDWRSQEILAELRVIRRLLAITVIEDKKQKDQVRILAAAGLDRNEIAGLLRTTPMTVSVTISNRRKEGTIRGRKREREKPGG